MVERGVEGHCNMTSLLDAPIACMQCFSGVITSLLALYLPIEEVLGMGVFSTTVKYQPSHSGGQIGLGTALTVFMVTQYGNMSNNNHNTKAWHGGGVMMNTSVAGCCRGSQYPALA